MACEVGFRVALFAPSRRKVRGAADTGWKDRYGSSCDHPPFPDREGSDCRPGSGAHRAGSPNDRMPVRKHQHPLTSTPFDGSGGTSGPQSGLTVYSHKNQNNFQKCFIIYCNSSIFRVSKMMCQICNMKLLKFAIVTINCHILLSRDPKCDHLKEWFFGIFSGAQKRAHGLAID